MERAALVEFLDGYLRIAEIEDIGPQGLQVESDNRQIGRLALAVDTSPSVIEAAADWRADMLLVHHGLLWRSVERIAGPFGQRVRLLLKHGINLYAAHLALDAHPVVGNNAVLANLLGVSIDEWWFAQAGTAMAVYGSVPPDTQLESFLNRIEEALGTQALLLAHGPQTVANVAILSGAGAGEVAAARALGADTFLTGETSHANFYAASDHGMNVIFAGHYATETVGVRALGRLLSQRFELETRFMDFPTGM